MSERLRRAIATMAVASLVSAACVMLGLWQWHRHLARSAAIAVVTSNYDAAPVPLDRAMAGDTTVAAGQEWQRVTATGHYLPDATVLLRNRPVNGVSGYHVLAPFLIDSGALSGTVLLVDRGFLPAAGAATAVPDVPAPPQGTVELVARLRVSERPTDRDAPTGQVQAIETSAARAAAPTRWSQPALTGYGQAVTEDGMAPARAGSARAAQHRSRTTPVVRVPVVGLRHRRAGRCRGPAASRRRPVTLAPARAPSPHGRAGRGRAPGRPGGGRPLDPAVSPVASRHPARSALAAQRRASGLGGRAPGGSAAAAHRHPGLDEKAVHEAVGPPDVVGDRTDRLTTPVAFDQRAGQVAPATTGDPGSLRGASSSSGSSWP